MTFLAFDWLFIFFRKSDKHARGRKVISGQIWTALVKVCTNGRLIVLIFDYYRVLMVTSVVCHDAGNDPFGGRGKCHWLVYEREL